MDGRPSVSRSRFPICGFRPGPRVRMAVARAIGPMAAALTVAMPVMASSIAALDCRNVSAQDVAQVLAPAPAPRVLALHGSVPIVTMAPFAAFLEAMGYPPERLAHPADGARSLSSFVDAERFAGELAWHYEREGMMPLLVGHSQGGMVVIKALHALARRDAPLPVWNPLTGAAEARTWIVDPASGARRAVNDLRVDFAAVLATGSLPRVLLAQWDVLPILRDVPDSVAHFSGFSIAWDPIAGTGPHPTPFRATGSADVRSVVLPATTSHIGLPNMVHLARDPRTRAWIDAWRPDAAPPSPAASDVTNLLPAADLWFSIKRFWCEAAQRREALRAGTRP